DQQVVRRRRSPIEYDRLVLGEEERQVAVELQRAVLAPNTIERGDLFADVAGSAPVAGADLELLGVQVFLASRAQRRVLTELEAAVHAIERRQRPGEQQPDQECGAAALLQVLVQDVGRIHEQVAAEV